MKDSEVKKLGEEWRQKRKALGCPMLGGIGVISLTPCAKEKCRFWIPAAMAKMPPGMTLPVLVPSGTVIPADYEIVWICAFDKIAQTLSEVLQKLLQFQIVAEVGPQDPTGKSLFGHE